MLFTPHIPPCHIELSTNLDSNFNKRSWGSMIFDSIYMTAFSVTTFIVTCTRVLRAGCYLLLHSGFWPKSLVTVAWSASWMPMWPNLTTLFAIQILKSLFLAWIMFPFLFPGLNIWILTYSPYSALISVLPQKLAFTWLCPCHEGETSSPWVFALEQVVHRRPAYPWNDCRTKLSQTLSSANTKWLHKRVLTQSM